MSSLSGKGAEEHYDKASQDGANLPGSGKPSPPNEKTEGVPRIGSLNSLVGEFLLFTDDIAQEGRESPPSEDIALDRRESPASSTPSPPMFLSNINGNNTPGQKHAQQDPGKPPLLPSRSKSSNKYTMATGEAFPKPLPMLSRASSTGDQSFMSALTDIDEYGGETCLLQQPFLTPTSQKSPNGFTKQHERKLTLDDLCIANTIETEAEAAIMRELEKRHAAEKNVAGQVLPAVPGDAVDMFQPAKGSRWKLVRDSAIAKHAPQRPPLSRGHSQRIIEPMETHDEDLPSNFYGTDKNKNVHESLFDLTGQIHEVQEVAVEKEEVDNVEIEGLNATNRVLLGADVPETELDTLAKNASVLFRRSAPLDTSESDAESDIESPSTADQEKKGLWFFRRRVKHQKKSDAPVPDDLEVDIGVAAAGDEEDPNHRDSPLKSAWQEVMSPVSTGGKKVARKAEAGVHHFHDFLKPRQVTMKSYSVTILKWIFLPTLIASFALYYANNPKLCEDGCASISWLLLFLFIRQIITFTLAKLTEIFVIDYLCLRVRLTARAFGANLTLLIVQSKGWPFTLLAWALWDFILLFGSGRFAKHWLFYQDAIPVFNEENPSGGITNSQAYTDILVVCIVVSTAVAVKRFWMGIHLGTRTYKRYSKQLAAVMNDMLLISLLAALGYDKGSQDEAIFKWDDIESDSELEEADSKSVETGTKSPRQSPRKATMDSRGSARNVAPGSDIEDLSRSPASPKVDAAPIIDSHILLQSSDRMSQKLKINQMLGEWDEPLVTDQSSNPSISAILQFRQALSYMDDDYPFSVFFGPARTRELCVESSQNLYERLMVKTPDQQILPFNTIALIATNEDGSINQHRLKRLYRLFHPDADGTLTLLDFVKSCDKVYKDLRILRASIANQSQIGKATESLFDAVFYTVLAFVVLPIVGVDPMALILALSGLIVGFAFMIGPASAAYFQGILFIVVQKPYDIGDRIHVSQCHNDTNTDGSPCWFVEKVDLYSTTVRFALTNEVATISNGALASSRIINAARSPKAIIAIRLKFGIDVDFTAVDVFQKSVESFVKARKREWLAVIGFRVTRIEADLGFVEYILVLQHTSSWQDVGAILKHKAEVVNYSREVAKRLQMRYEAPPLPVKLDLSKAEHAMQALSGSGVEASAGDGNAT